MTAREDPKAGGASGPLAGCNCKECPYARNGGPNVPVLHDGTILRPRGLVVADAPNQRDTDEGRLLSGPTGDKFDEALESAGLRRGDLLIFPAFACQPKEPRDDKDVKKAIGCCRPMRDYYFAKGNGASQLIMGKWANLAVGFKRALDGKESARGFIYPGSDTGGGVSVRNSDKGLP